MRESIRRDLILVVLTLLIAGLLFTLSRQGSRRVAAAPMAAATNVASTATPAAQIRPDQPTAVAVSMVEGRDQLLLNLLARIERQLAEAEETAIPPAAVVVPSTATPTPALSVWEDGTCWTPADMQVLHLCGADAGDGYVIRWIGVSGDSRGPEIADADWLAVRGGGDRLVWSGHHPATGEAVTVNYWSGGHTLAVHAAGRLLVRIDREHFVTQ